MKIYDPQMTCKTIFEYSANRGWSDFKFAQILGVTPQAISKWRRGIGSPSLDTLVILTGLFQISLDEMIGISEVDYEIS